MIKVFENFDFSRVGQMQSVLESNGIRTFIRNQYGSSVMGEVPFIEVVPQLFVLEDRDAPQARALLRGLEEPPQEALDDWTCPECGAGVEGNFGCCWQCGAARPEA